MGCTRLLLYFKTNKPHHSFFFFCRILVVLENRRSSQGGVRSPCTLPLDPPLTSILKTGASIMKRWNNKQTLPCLFFIILAPILSMLVINTRQSFVLASVVELSPLVESLTSNVYEVQMQETTKNSCPVWFCLKCAWVASYLKGQRTGQFLNNAFWTTTVCIKHNNKQ